MENEIANKPSKPFPPIPQPPTPLKANMALIKICFMGFPIPLRRMLPVLTESPSVQVEGGRRKIGDEKIDQKKRISKHVIAKV